MKRNALTILTVAALALMAALPVAAQRGQGQRPMVKPSQQEPTVIALQARVDRRSQVYGVNPNTEAIPIREGERLRIDLVGTALVNGDGVERPVNARFEVGAGRGRIEIVQAGPNWVVVQAKSRGDNGMAQIAYEVTSNYEMKKGGLRTGRITFEIGEGAISSDAPIQEGDRWRKAQDLNWRLYTSILNQEPRGTAADDDLNHIYRLGYGGVRDVAVELARNANLDTRRLSEEDAVAILGDLYRGLLRRNTSDRDLWDSDRGFRNNVQALRDRGLERAVQGIVDAEEFRSVNQLHQWGPLSADQLPRDYNSASWRRDRG